MKRILPIAIVAVLIVAGVAISFSVGGGGGSETQRSTADHDAAADTAVSRARAEVDEFVTAGGDACNLSRGEPAGLLGPGYPSLEALINDVDVVIEGELTGTSLEEPRGRTAAARVFSTVVVSEALVGDLAMESFTLESGVRVVLRGDEVARVSNRGFDPCTSDRAVFFLRVTDAPDMFELAGFYTIEGTSLDASRSSALFDSGLSNASLKAQILEIAADQEQQNLPQGRLLCESYLGSEDFQDPFACPGDTYNPYEVYGLARLLSAGIESYDNDGQNVEGRGVPTDSVDLVSMLALFDAEFTLTAGRRPTGNLIKIIAETTTTGTPPVSVVLDYYPESGLIWIALSGATISAPDGLGEALERILQGSP